MAGLLGADTLLGVDDPFVGWLADEIEEAWEQVRAALAERRFIEIQPDGRIVMDVAVATLVGTCSFPEASFIVTFANGALVALARQETTWESAGLGLLEGENGLWRLRAFTREGENWVEVIPCDGADACRAIRWVMNRVLPEPLSPG